MAKNTGRGSRSGAIYGGAHHEQWTDISDLPWVVWSEPEGVAVYEGEKDVATRRRLMSPGQARAMAGFLLDAANHTSTPAETS